MGLVNRRQWGLKEKNTSNRCRKANVLLVKAFWESSELSSSWHKHSEEVCLPLRQSLVILGWMEWASQLLVGAVCTYSLKAHHLVVLLLVMEKELEPFPSFDAMICCGAQHLFPVVEGRLLNLAVGHQANVNTCGLCN